MCIEVFLLILLLILILFVFNNCNPNNGYKRENMIPIQYAPVAFSGEGIAQFSNQSNSSSAFSVGKSTDNVSSSVDASDSPVSFGNNSTRQVSVDASDSPVSSVNNLTRQVSVDASDSPVSPINLIRQVSVDDSDSPVSSVNNLTRQVSVDANDSPVSSVNNLGVNNSLSQASNDTNFSWSFSNQRGGTNAFSNAF